LPLLLHLTLSLLCSFGSSDGLFMWKIGAQFYQITHSFGTILYFVRPLGVSAVKKRQKTNIMDYYYYKLNQKNLTQITDRITNLGLAIESNL